MLGAYFKKFVVKYKHHKKAQATDNQLLTLHFKNKSISRILYARAPLSFIWPQAHADGLSAYPPTAVFCKAD